MFNPFAGDPPHEPPSDSSARANATERTPELSKDEVSVRGVFMCHISRIENSSDLLVVCILSVYVIDSRTPLSKNIRIFSSCFIGSTCVY